MKQTAIVLGTVFTLVAATFAADEYAVKTVQFGVAPSPPLDPDAAVKSF